MSTRFSTVSSATSAILFDMILFVEQPFPYELEKHQIDVRSVSRRKPLFMDESAHDWRHVRRGPSSAGRASRSRPARRRPARCCRSAGRRPTA